MPETTVISCQRIVLLRSLFAIVVCLSVLLPCVAPASAQAPLWDYNDYITNVAVDGDNDIVSISLPVDSALFQLFGFPSYGHLDSGGNPSVFDCHPGNLFSDTGYVVRCIPFSGANLRIDNIPDGTELKFGFSVTTSSGAYNTPDLFSYVEYLDADGTTLSTSLVSYGKAVFGESMELGLVLNRPAGAKSVVFDIRYENFLPTGSSSSECTFRLKSLTAKMSISSLYRLQEQTGETNQLLTEVKKELAENGQTLDQILQEQEKLPDKIGDEMQGIIDKEKNDSSTEGNKFVDQILDVLPDPSADVLVALKTLTDATSYQGTEAELPIPALVLPGIDGLFPASELWSGTDLDFSEYVSMLPLGLLTLVQSLFTIAIVLFCVFELKGIISYCLTLRESKGG